MIFTLLFLLSMLFLFLMLRIFNRILTAKSAQMKQKKQIVFSHNIFRYLILFICLWLCLLILLKSQKLSSAQAQTMVTIITIFAPIFIWWWSKKSSEGT
jgi:hypothetical protein